jgi:hypothetical protein
LLGLIQVHPVKEETPGVLTYKNLLLTLWADHVLGMGETLPRPVPLTLVQFKSQETLEELLADPALARVLKPWPPQAKLGMARVAPEDLAAVRGLLAERGVEVRDA